MSYQTSSKRSPPFWLLIGARKHKNWTKIEKKKIEAIPSLSRRLADQNGGAGGQKLSKGYLLSRQKNQTTRGQATTSHW